MLFVAVASCGAAFSQTKRTGGPTPSAPGAEVYFIDLKDGTTVPAKLKIYFPVCGTWVLHRPDRIARTPVITICWLTRSSPPLDQPIPNDFTIFFFGAGQTETEITLKPGAHTLQLLMGDTGPHPHTPPVMSPLLSGSVSLILPRASRRRPTPGSTLSAWTTVGSSPEGDDSLRPRQIGVAPAGIDKPKTGHHHLLIDTKLPPLDDPIPNDFNHLHFGAGQTEAIVTLAPGRHTLQLLLGDENRCARQSSDHVKADQGLREQIPPPRLRKQRLMRKLGRQ